MAYDKEDEARTVFCGNLPNHPNINETRVKDLFQSYGEIKSVRLRSENGKIIYSKKSRNKCKSFIAYVVFKNLDEAKKSLDLNGFQIHENYLRVNMANSKKEAFSNVKGIIFVGNLKFEVTPNEVQDYFSSVGNIEYVRVLPNKGIAYVCFQKGTSIIQALKLNGKHFKGRPLRIERYVSKEKQEKKKMFKRDPKTGKILRQKVKKQHKIEDEKLLKGRSNNNPIIKKIRDTQKAKFNKFSMAEKIPKKELFKRNNVEVTRERKPQIKENKFFGKKVDKTKKKSKPSKSVKDKKVLIKKLKSAAGRAFNK